MSPDLQWNWQDLVAVVTVLVAASYLGLRILRSIRRKTARGCGGCAGCPTDAQQQSPLTDDGFVSVQQLKKSRPR